MWSHLTILGDARSGCGRWCPMLTEAGTDQAKGGQPRRGRIATPARRNSRTRLLASRSDCAATTLSKEVNRLSSRHRTM